MVHTSVANNQGGVSNARHVMIVEDPDNHGPIENFQLTVPQATGDVAVIEQLQSCQAVKKLDLFAPPEGGPQNFEHAGHLQ